MPTVTQIVAIGDFSDGSYLKGKKWTPIVDFDFNGNTSGDSVANVKVTGTFTDIEGNAGKPKNCTTNKAGQCSIYGKKRKYADKEGTDYSTFVLVSIVTADRTELNPKFEMIVTWIEDEKGTLY